jgi:drug/metabolite transporter (DMT)-like permease
MMSLSNIFSFLFLSAAWGGSYLFIRLSIADFGPIPMAELRLGLASLVLLPVMLIKPSWRQHLLIKKGEWSHLTIIGILNSALPFCLIAFAMQTLSAGVGSILNSTAPIWGALVAAIWLGERLSVLRIIGLIVGVVGVVVLVWGKAYLGQSGEGLQILSILMATLSYGLAANYIKKYGAAMHPLKLTVGSMVIGAILVGPLAYQFWPSKEIAPQVWLAVIGLGVISTAYAYVVYFQLIEKVGPARAIAVTFLIPVFGMIWGGLFLDELVTPRMLIGASIVLLGTALATGVLKRLLPT